MISSGMLFLVGILSDKYFAMLYNIVYLLGVKSFFDFILFYELLFKSVRESLRLFEEEVFFLIAKRL